MLRLEKIRKSDDVTVILRQKTPFFNPTLCLALLWAIGVHVFGMLFFQVAPFKINYTDSLFPPVAVETDLGLPIHGNVQAFIEDSFPIPEYLQLPLKTDISSPEIPRYQPKRELEYYQPASLTFHSFLSIDLSYLSYAQVSLEPAAPASFKVHISGPLAKHQKQNSIIDIPFSFSDLRKGEYLSVFDVLMDGKSGKIIWFQPRGKSHPKLLQWYNTIIKEMSFEPSLPDTIISGQIEFFLQLPYSQER